MLSILLYFVFFGGGFLVDKYYKDNKKVKNTFVVLLYVFLCFGYMTGSDWRSYELTYDYINQTPFFYVSETGFYTLFRLLRNVISDYWLAVGILKCLYLYTLLRTIKKLTPYWLSVTSLLITSGLSFVLIDNPLRFMVSLILVNVAFEFVLDKKYLISAAIVVAAFFFHNTSIFFIFVIPIVLLAEKISGINRLFLSVLYVGVVFISSQAALIEAIRGSVVGQFMLLDEGMKNFNVYSVETNVSFFSIGNFLGIFFFFLVVIARNKVIEEYENGKFIYGMTIFYLVFARLLILIPTGFRLNIPFQIFYMTYIAYLIWSKNMIKWFFIVYLCVSFPRTLWNSYTYIPYSNSIPYIITGHKSYMERSLYNYEAYQERTGKAWDKD